MRTPSAGSLESAGDITCYDVTKVTRVVQQRIKTKRTRLNRIGAYRLLDDFPISTPASSETTSSIQFFLAMSIEAQQYHPLDDVDDFSPGSGEEKVACMAVRPAVNHQPQPKEQRAWGLEPHKCQTNQNTRTTRQRWQLWVPWISLAIILYTFIPWESPYLSWLGPHSPLLHSAQEVFNPAMSKPSTGHSPLDDPDPGPNVSCR